MKALTLLEPWGSLITVGKKTIETRSWRTSYRGELLIHTGVRKIPSQKCQARDLFETYLFPAEPIYGCVVAKCILIDCIAISEQYAREIAEEQPLNYALGDFGIGRYAWILKNVRPVEPTPAKGRLGLWEYGIDIGGKAVR